MSSSFRRLYLDVLLGGAQLVLLAFGLVLPGRATLPIVLALIAAVSLLAWVAVYRRLRRIEDTPTSTIAGAAQGYVELSGRCESVPGTPTEAPYSHLACAWCRYMMEEYRDRKWVRSDAGETDASFQLRDATGTCAVDPSGAEIVTDDKETWAEGNYRYTEWRIRPHDTLYVLGEFRTLSKEPSAADKESDVSALLAAWKQDHAALLARFDANRNGEIDLAEWERARLAARTEVEQNYREMQAAPELCGVRKPADGRQFLIANVSQQALARKYRIWGWLHLAIFICAMAGLGRSLVV